MPKTLKRKMTPREFFAALREHRHKFKWFFTHDDRVITASISSIPWHLDPLTVLTAAILNRALRLTQPMLAGEELGLEFRFTHQVMLATSIPSHPMRQRLLMACGLVEDTGDAQFQKEGEEVARQDDDEEEAEGQPGLFDTEE